jgi:hypothetical protein
MTLAKSRPGEVRDDELMTKSSGIWSSTPVTETDVPIRMGFPYSVSKEKKKRDTPSGGDGGLYAMPWPSFHRGAVTATDAIIMRKRSDGAYFINRGAN